MTRHLFFFNIPENFKSESYYSILTKKIQRMARVSNPNINIQRNINDDFLKQEH